MEQRISLERMEQAANLFGSFDENIRLLEQEFDVAIHNRDGEIKIDGDAENVMMARKAVEGLLSISARGETIGEQNVRYVMTLVKTGKADKIADMASDILCVSSKGRPVKPKTIGQGEYIKSILRNTVTIGVGPAGTGKTYLAVAAAVRAFRDKQVNRIILTRPAVEAGERLGFLPGDLQSKVDPYLRPLYDALFDLLGAETYQKYLERGNIEIAPLAYMRGRTLDDSFIILDEAQNTSREQMKMFLTRLGFGSKIVITGDATQIDLPDGKESGLKEAIRVLRDVEGIGICELTDADVVRHVMVQRIVQAYAAYEEQRNLAREARENLTRDTRQNLTRDSRRNFAPRKPDKQENPGQEREYQRENQHENTRGNQAGKRSDKKSDKPQKREYQSGYKRGYKREKNPDKSGKNFNRKFKLKESQSARKGRRR